MQIFPFLTLDIDIICDCWNCSSHLDYMRHKPKDQTNALGMTEQNDRWSLGPCWCYCTFKLTDPETSLPLECCYVQSEIFLLKKICAAQ